MTTISTLFSGGEGVGTGARMADLKHLWGIEYDDAIAQVARDNGFNTITADVLDVDPLFMERPDVLHASPICTNASVANSDGEESELDKATARQTVQFINALRPDWFTLENVYPYRNFQSFQIITDALSAAGYSWDYWHVNSADYGVPQTRKRLILIAGLGRGRRMVMPPVTHHNPADYVDGQMFMFAPNTLPWVGWYEAIEDLIPTLPESKFADWQLKRLPSEIKTKAFLIGDGDNYRPVVNGPEPSPTVSSSNGARAFLLGNNANDTSGALIYVDENAPAQTVRTPGGGRVQRVFIASGALNDNSTTLTTRNDETPMITVTTSHNQKDLRAWLFSGRVVKMTVRALARFQSFPDDYILPDKDSLAVKIIGNSVPPLLYEQISAPFKLP